MKRLPMHFVARCPRCGKEMDALTMIGLRDRVAEHALLSACAKRKAAKPKPRNGELFGDSGVA